jgi:signal transduction histidine kinase
MSDGGVLHVTLASTDRFLSLAFRDTGPGLPPDKLGRLFDPYFTTKDKGSGLGLIIVQRILRDHGGEIEIHSEPGRGTTFTLLLPREDRRIRLLRAPRRGGERPSGGKGERA